MVCRGVNSNPILGLSQNRGTSSQLFSGTLFPPFFSRVTEQLSLHRWSGRDNSSRKPRPGRSQAASLRRSTPAGSQRGVLPWPGQPLALCPFVADLNAALGVCGLRLTSGVSVAADPLHPFAQKRTLSKNQCGHRCPFDWFSVKQDGLSRFG